jgi:hypothetical protein
MVVGGGVNIKVSRKFAFHPAKYYGQSYTGMRLLALEMREIKIKAFMKTKH